MNVTPSTRLALDPQYCLRNDIDRAVLITRPRPLSFDKSYVFRLLHPREAVLLALLDGERSLEEVHRLWEDLSGRTPEDAAREVDELLGFYTTGEAAERGFLVEVDEGNRGSVRRYDPRELATPADRVNLSDPRLRRPYTVVFLPTLACSQRCVYCHAMPGARVEEEPIPLRRLQEVFSELRGLGVEVVHLTGGEPFARRDMFDILEALFDEGITPDISTKYGLSFYEALRLKDLGIHSVEVGIDSADPNILDRMAGVKGHHTRVFRGLDNLRRAGVGVRVRTVLTPLNAPTMGSLIDYLGALGNVVRLALVPYRRSRFCHRDELFLDPADRELVAEQWRVRSEIYPQMKVSFCCAPAPRPEEKERLWRERPQCTANRHGFVILPDGRVTACEELYDHPVFLMGDMKRQSVMEMWTSPEALAMLRPDPGAVPDGPCRDCRDFAQCNGGRGRCWRDVVKAYGAERPHYPDPRCPLAPPGNRLN